jgi:hypothetical protein
MYAFAIVQCIRLLDLSLPFSFLFFSFVKKEHMTREIATCYSVLVLVTFVFLERENE